MLWVNRLGLCGVAVFCFVGCGKELGRVAFSSPGTGETSVALDASKEVDFWTDLDVEWEGPLLIGYAIELEQDGKKVASAVCNALEVSTTIASVTTDFGNSHSRSYDGKMRCSTKVPTSGMTKVRVASRAEPAPKELTKFDLVIKQ